MILSIGQVGRKQLDRIMREYMAALEHDRLMRSQAAAAQHFKRSKIFSALIGAVAAVLAGLLFDSGMQFTGGACALISAISIGTLATAEPARSCADSARLSLHLVPPNSEVAASDWQVSEPEARSLLGITRQAKTVLRDEERLAVPDRLHDLQAVID